MMIRIYTLVSVIFLAVSCGTKSDESLLVIDTQLSEPSEMKLSQLFQNNGMVILETNDSCLISHISQIIRSANELFILTSKGNENEIMKFNAIGNFICRIGRTGHGPGEYHSLRDLAIDTLNKRLIAATDNEILFYNYDGSFNKSFPLEANIIVQDLYWMDESLWIFGIHFKSGSVVQYFFNCYDRNFQKKDSLIVSQYTSDHIRTVANPNIVSDITIGRYLYFPVINRDLPLFDTLYQLNGHELVPAIKLDFTSITENEDPEIEIHGNISSYELEYIHTLSLQEIFRTDDLLFAKYQYSVPYWFVYNFHEKTGNIIVSGFKDDLFIDGNNQFFMPIPLDLRKGEFYYTISGMYLEGKIEGVKENSNPVIFFMKTKVTNGSLNPSPITQKTRTQYPVPSTQYPAPSTQHPAPSTQHPVPRT